jgi:hypothetical protein
MRKGKDVRPDRSMTAMLDETGDPGSRAHGKRYVLGATVIDDDRLGEFSDITRKRWKGKELKFREQATMRDEVLDEISALKPRLYAVTVTKPRFRSWDSREQRDVHRNALSKLVGRIAGKEGAASIRMIIDENTKAKEGAVREITDRVATVKKKSLTAEIRRSKDSFPLQTNDFSIGAMGKKYNRRDGQYAARLPRIDRSRMIIGKTRAVRTKK